MRPSVPVTPTQPLTVVGAGPIGLAAAAHAAERGLPTVVLEAGDAVGAAVSDWGHVRLFSPWSELVDEAAGRLLDAHGWQRPDPTAYPTGAEWVGRYLLPLADALAGTGLVEVRTRHRVVGLARRGRDRVVAAGRDEAPLTVHVATADGRRRLAAAAVVDASGTWATPAPLGGDGYPADGEPEHADRIATGIPDLADPAVRQRYAGRHVAVAGSGASAHHVLVALRELAGSAPGTRVTWLLRRTAVGDAFGGGADDELVARGALGERARRAVADGPVTTVTGFRTEEVRGQADGRLTLVSGDREVTDVDEVVVVTGFRPDHTWLSEVVLDLDGELGAPRALAPGIHPAHHSCGTVAPHGASVLGQPDRGLYLAGTKSYGRAPSFLALTGHEQVRSIVAEVAGDQAAADRVDLVLPETGVCHGAGGYDGSPAAAPTDDTAPADSADTAGCCATPAGVQPLTLGAPAPA